MARMAREGTLKHPDLRKLIDYDSDVLPPAERDAIRDHLRGCAECRLELGHISSAAGPDDAQNDGGLLAGILAGMERWDSTHSKDESVKAKVGSDLAPFLGPQATDQLLRATSVQGDNLLSTVEPVVALFLGCRAASALIDHIVVHSILRAF